MSPHSTLATVLGIAQVCVILTLIGEVHRRWTGTRRILAWSAIGVFEGVVLVSYLTSYANRFASTPWGNNHYRIGVASVMYLFTSACVLAVYLVIRPVWRRLDAATDPGRRKVLSVGGNALLCAPVAVISYGSLIQRTNFEVREVDVPMPGLAASLDGLRILHISDIHLSPFLSEKELARVVDATRGLHPHLAFVTGDLISTSRDPLDACIRQLARLKADAGVFGSMGNHEHYAGVEGATVQMGAQAGIRFLRSEAQPLRFGDSVLNIAGVDYQTFGHRRHYLQGQEHLVAPAAFNLLLSHNPDVFPFAARQGYDLVLAGHTHGGQINVEIFGESINPARYFTPYVYGLYRQGRSAEYVTRGVGTIGAPLRLGAPPEVALLRLRKT